IPKEISGTNYTVRVGNETSYVGWNDRMASESTLYRGRVVKFNTDDSRVFKILHNSSGVYVVDG
ncbi:MAG: hypothetical protein ABEJ93_00075, partial [Candidatus Nanohalobium sp.]